MLHHHDLLVQSVPLKTSLLAWASSMLHPQYLCHLQCCTMNKLKLAHNDFLVVIWMQQMSSEVMEPKTHMGHAIVQYI